MSLVSVFFTLLPVDLSVHSICHALQILTLFANSESWLVEFISTLGWLLSLITNVWLSDASSCGSGGSYSIGRTVDRSRLLQSEVSLVKILNPHLARMC